MAVQLNPYHMRIGAKGNGFLPTLTHGGSLGVIAYPDHLATAPDKPETVCLHLDVKQWRADLTPAEARDLAAVLLRMADKAEGRQ